MNLNPSRTHFPPAMLAACEAALDAGIFYNDQFDDFVFKHMGGFGCDAVLIEVVDLDGAAPDFWDAQRELNKRLEAAVLTAPRGHYAVIRQQTASVGTIYKTIVSDGHGDRPATGGSFDTYREMPTLEKVLERFVGYEIYLCRKMLEQERAHQSARKAISDYGIRPGMEFRNIEIRGEKFSTASVTEIHESTGEVTLNLVRRGSRQRWTTTLAANALVKRAGMDIQRAAAEATEDLFSLA